MKTQKEIQKKLQKSTRTLRHLFSGAALALTLLFVPLSARAEGTQEMYRLYNEATGEHFYTASTNERDTLVSWGWKSEGAAWTAPASSDTPVYRLLDPNSGDHHYTMDAGERNALIALGWTDEGIGWYSDDALSAPLYRLYNPNAATGSHHYTMDAGERDALVALGWQDEGIGWYGASGSATVDPARQSSDQDWEEGERRTETRKELWGLEATYVYVYDKNGVERQRLIYAYDGTLLGMNEYDANGNCVKETDYGSDGSIRYISEYEYDANGNCVKWTRYGSDGSIRYISEYEYDADGKLVAATEYDGDGNVISSYR